ncbi:MAG: cytochrome c peroxidase [Bacteroidia bacterium]
MKSKVLLSIIVVSFLSLQFVTTNLAVFSTQPTLPATPYDYTTIVIPSHLSNNVLNGPGQNAAVNNDNTPLTNPTTNEGATLGRVLFYDKKLSSNQTISCASCHDQAKGFSDDRILSIGFQGGSTRRHSMGLTNAVWYDRGRFFWDERAATLEEQVLMPFQDTVEMGMTLAGLVSAVQSESYYPPLFQDAFGTTVVDSSLIARALAQFIRSMVSVNSKYDSGRAQVTIPTANFANFTTSENNGKRLFFLPKTLGGLSCVGCHSTEAFINPDAGTTNNGLDSVSVTDLGVFEAIPNPAFLGTFKVPSLKNIELTAPYMHDGRLATLEDVVEHYNSGVLNHPNLNSSLKDNGVPQRLNLTATEKTDLVNFLKTLTDDVLVNDVKFSDPFDSSLPIELLSFSARPNNNQEIVLEWSTSFESNTDKFVLQRSLDGNLFEKIGEVDAMGESNTIQQYRFSDIKPYAGKSYYRFEQWDLDGKSSYSEIKIAHLNQSKSLRVYPNPIDNNGKLRIESSSNLPLQIEICTMQGGQVFRDHATDNQYINLPKLAPGIYFYKIGNAEVERTGKLIIR